MTIEKKGWLIERLWFCHWSWFRFCYSEAFPPSQQRQGSRRKQDKQQDVWVRRDPGTRSLWDWWTYCVITWPCDRMMDFICVGQSSNVVSPAESPLWRGQFVSEAAAWSRFEIRLPLKLSSIKWSQAVSYLSQLCWSAAEQNVFCSSVLSERFSSSWQNYTNSRSTYWLSTLSHSIHQETEMTHLTTSWH